MQSSDVDSTLMSAAYNLAGIFPVAIQTSDGSAFWQTIPIHIIPRETDNVLYMKAACPLYDRIYEKYEQSSEMKSMFDSNKTLIQYLEFHSGQNIHSTHDIVQLYDSLRIEQFNNLT